MTHRCPKLHLLDHGAINSFRLNRAAAKEADRRADLARMCSFRLGMEML